MLKKEEIKNVMDSCADGAWYGTKSKRCFETKLGTKLTFTGHIYEPCYEAFESTCDVSLEKDGTKRILFAKKDRSVAPYKKKVEITGSIKDIEEIVQNENFYEV